MSDIIAKIAKVLNQAENASTEAEGEAYLKAAQALSTKYSIELAEARAHIAKDQKRESPVRATVDFADFGRNTKKHLVNLFSAIAGPNDVRIDIAHNSTRVYPYGFPSDIELCETLFAHLAMQMVEEANKFLATGEYKKETTTTLVRRKVYSEDGWYYERSTGRYYDWDEKYVEKPVDGRVARTNFYSAFISRVGRRLDEARRETIAEVIKDETKDETGSTGTELVLAAKKEEVDAHYKATSNARGSWKGVSSSAYSSSSHSAGSAAGARARISGQGSIGGAKGALTS
jgi:hypothetical protein